MEKINEDNLIEIDKGEAEVTWKWMPRDDLSEQVIVVWQEVARLVMFLNIKKVLQERE